MPKYKLKFFYLKGSFDGDGHYRKNKPVIEINLTDFDFLEEIRQQIKNVFNIDVYIKNHTPAHDNCKEQRKIYFGCGKEIYNALKNARPKTKEEKIEYLKGLWDAEGSVGLYDKKIIRKGKEYKGHEKKLVITQKDILKLDLWHKYMKSLDINSLKMYRNDNRSELSIRDNNSWKKFHELIGFRIKRKQERLNDIIKQLMPSKMTEDMQNKMIAIYNNTNFGVQQIGKMFGKSKYGTIRMLNTKGINTDKELGRQLTNNDIEFAEKIIGKELSFKIPISRMKKYSAENLQSVKIKSIIFSHEECGVDLSTPGPENFFLSNGVLSHNSTLAFQMAAFVDWCLQGGKMIWDADGKVTGMVQPTKPLRFGLDNVVFSPEELIAITKLKGKRQKYNVFVLDEGREGLLGARVMETVNKKFEDYFQTCGVYNNFVIIVLPDFFKLAEQYCVNRSVFLVNVFHKNFERGYFSFFNTIQKERLYFFGKKRLGISARYNAASRNFWGRFSKWLPFNETKYNNKKKAAIGKAKWTKYDVAQMRQRDLLCYLLYKSSNLTLKEISEKMAGIGAKEYTPALVARSLFNAKRIQNQDKYIPDEGELPEDLSQEVDFKNIDEGTLEIIKDPVASAGFAKEYNNSDLSTSKMVEGILPEGARVVGTSKMYVDKDGVVSNLAQSADADADEGPNFAIGPLDPLWPEKKDKDLTEHPKRILKAIEEMKNPDDLYDDDEMTVEKYKLPDRHARSPDRSSAEEEIDPDKSPVDFEMDEELLDDPKFKQDFESNAVEIKKAIGVSEKMKPEQKKLEEKQKKDLIPIEEDHSEYIYKG